MLPLLSQDGGQCSECKSANFIVATNARANNEIREYECTKDEKESAVKNSFDDNGK